MKISLAIHFPLCLSRHECSECRKIHRKCLEIHLVSRKIRRKYLDKHLGKWIARLKCTTVLLYNYQTYINSYCVSVSYFSLFMKKSFLSAFLTAAGRSIALPLQLPWGEGQLHKCLEKHSTNLQSYKKAWVKNFFHSEILFCLSLLSSRRAYVIFRFWIYVFQFNFNFGNCTASLFKLWKI